MHQQPTYAPRRRRPRIEGPYLRDQRESRAPPPDPEPKGAGPRGSAGQSRLSAIPIRTCCGSSIPATPLSRWQSKRAPVGGFAYGPRGIRAARFSRPDLIEFMKVLRESTGWASISLGSSPEAGAKMVENAITAIRAYPELARVTVDVAYDEPPALPSLGADVRQRGHSSPMPPPVPLPRPFQSARLEKYLGKLLQLATDDQQPPTISWTTRLGQADETGFDG